MRRFLVTLCLVALAGCGHKKSAGPTPPAGAAVLSSFVEQGVSLLFPALNSVDAILPLLGNPEAPGRGDVTFVPNTLPGAPPHSYVFQLPLDGDQDGTAGGTLTGQCVLSGDPAEAAVGYNGTIELNASLAAGLGSLAGNLRFQLTEQGTQLSGTATFTEMVSGHSVDMTVDDARPLLLKPASGEAGAVGNACSYSLDGPVEVDARGGSTSLVATWNFSSNSRDATITGATYSDGEHEPESVADSSYRISCGSATLAQWTGVYRQEWSCLPAEHGAARLTITQAGPSTLHVVDEDPPGSGQVHAYDATIVSGNAGVVHGFFIGGEAPNTYREDFTWTLAPDHQGFTQISLYRYQGGGSLTGGGICAARVVRDN